MKILTPNRKTYKGVIFDLDGTLLDTIEDLTDSINAALQDLGHPTHSPEAVMQMVGNGFRNLLIRALPPSHQSPQEIDDAVTRFANHYALLYANKTEPYPGILSLVADLTDRGIPMGINSNKRHDYTCVLVEKWFPSIAFAGVYGEMEKQGIPKKPDPTAALAIASAMQLSPEDVLFVGDSRPDIETGHNAGMDCAAVTWGFRTAADLEANGADYLIETAEELLDLF